jgi:hypothetical protein
MSHPAHAHTDHLKTLVNCNSTTRAASQFSQCAHIQTMTQNWNVHTQAYTVNCHKKVEFSRMCSRGKLSQHTKVLFSKKISMFTRTHTDWHAYTHAYTHAVPRRERDVADRPAAHWQPHGEPQGAQEGQRASHGGIGSGAQLGGP